MEYVIVNFLYYGECFKGGFHSSKAPQVNATIQNDYFNKKIQPKEKKLCDLMLNPCAHGRIFCTLARNLKP